MHIERQSNSSRMMHTIYTDEAGCIVQSSAICGGREYLLYRDICLTLCLGLEGSENHANDQQLYGIPNVALPIMSAGVI